MIQLLDAMICQNTVKGWRVVGVIVTIAKVLIPILIILAAITGCKSTHYNHMCNCDCCCCGTGTCDCRCCFDSYHYCQHCGKEIGRRNSCIEICPCFDCC